MIGERLAGIAVGGALCVIGAITLWPPLATAPALDILAGRLSQLACRLQVISGMVPAASGELAEMVPVGSVIDALEERPASPTAADRAALYLLNDAERLDRLLRRTDPAALTGAEQEAAARLAVDVQNSSARLAAITRPGRPAFPARPEPARIGSGVRPQPPSSPYSLMTRAALVIANIGRHADVITHRSTVGSPAPWTRFAPGTSSRGLRAHGLLRVRANMTWRSVHLQDAVRLGVALGLAVAVARVLGLEHGFWVALATLTIVRSTVSATGRRAGQALAGTAVGFAVAFAIIEAARTHTTVYAALTPVVIFGAIYAGNAIGFLAGQAAFTVAVLVLFSLLARAGWRIGVVRVEDVAAGALIGLAVGAVAWPRRPAAAIGPAIAGLLDASSRYLIRTLQVMTGGQQGAGPADPGGSDPAGLVRTRQLATSAAIVAESAFAEYLGIRPGPAAVRETLWYLSATSRLWYAADILRTMPSGEPGFPRWDTMAPLAHALEDTADRAASRLRGRRAQQTPPDGPTQPEEPGRPPGYPENSLEGWIDDLTRQLTPGRVPGHDSPRS